MSYILLTAFSCINIFYFHSGLCASIQNKDTLILVHTIFRHGNRTVDDEIYPGNPYGNESYYEPFGYGQLSNVGKRTEYKIGQALRRRYDQFLGKEFNIRNVEAWTTNVNRTKMSLLLVLASLYPPEKRLVWNENLDWQPIPYSYSDKNKELSSAFVCKNFKEEFNSIYYSEKIQKQLSVYQEVYDYLSEHTNKNITNIKQVANLFVELKAQESYGYPLPNWAKKYYPETMEKITIDYYYLGTNTTELRKIVAGFLIRKILKDTENKINGDLALEDRKIYIYSAHEKNIGTLLITMGIFDNALPNFGAYVLVEVHKIKEVYGFKIFYQNYEEKDPILKTIPGCSEFCSIEEFESLLGEYIPKDSDCVM